MQRVGVVPARRVDERVGVLARCSPEGPVSTRAEAGGGREREGRTTPGPVQVMFVTPHEVRLETCSSWAVMGAPCVNGKPVSLESGQQVSAQHLILSSRRPF